MDGKRAAPGDPDTTEAAADDEQGSGSERYGPLELRRLRKDDGRALIVFSAARTDDTER